jgi:NAD(P)-dependent dehydrogenase (short-subunit alcohol dehydrogenase family)
MDTGLKGKVAAVTGASRGIGEATAVLFAREGMKVAICARGKEGLDKVADKIKAEGGECLPFPVDLGSPDGADRFIAATVETFGQVNVLANVAGFHEVKPFLETSDPEWYRVFENNFFGPMRACRAVIPYMQRQGGGSIINVSAGSIHKTIKDRRDDHPHYTSAKAAFAMLSKYLARDFGKDNIRVNTILPAYSTKNYDAQLQQALSQGKTVVEFNQDFMKRIAPYNFSPDLERPGRPEEFASVILFLASDWASYVTGATVPVDGGAMDFY